MFEERRAGEFWARGEYLWAREKESSGSGSSRFHQKTNKQSVRGGKQAAL